MNRFGKRGVKLRNATGRLGPPGTIGWNRAAEHDSDLASRRRERMAKELEQAQDDAAVTIRATLDKVKERIEGMDPEELSAGQIPSALRTLIELEFKVLGYEDRVAVTGKDGGPVRDGDHG